MVDSTDEKHLLIDLKGGSFQAFERLYNMYSGKLYNFIMRLSSGNQYMAEEVVQATFIRIWEVHEKVDPTSSFIFYGTHALPISICVPVIRSNSRLYLVIRFSSNTFSSIPTLSGL